ncbi:hypothetical protein ACQ4PT_041366 [Festuca glaucescens]
MLTRAFCCGGDADGAVAAASLVVTAYEVAVDLPLLLRHQLPLLGLLRFVAAHLRHEPEDGGEVIVVEEVAGREAGRVVELGEDPRALRVLDVVAGRERGRVLDLHLHRNRLECLSETSSRCVMNDAVHNFEMINCALLQGMGVGKCIKSSTFSAGGHDWNIRFYPDGDTNESAAGHPSAFLSCLSLQAKDGVKAKFRLTMLDDQGNAQEIHKDSLADDLEHTLKNGRAADLTLLVGGREFKAHSLILAVRSPVFYAQLFGPMRDKNTQHIEVDDIEPTIFEMLLHFVYTDSLPPCSKEDHDVATMQHLLVAADRYGLDRLKVMCEDKLCNSIGVKTITSTLALANQHYCERLKDACVDFMSKPGVTGAVLLSEGFQSLIAGCTPLVLEKDEKDKEVPAKRKLDKKD